MKNNYLSPFCLVVIFSICLMISGCISGPKDPEASIAEQFNGDNYNSPHESGPNSVVTLPFLERREVQRVLNGTVYCGEGLAQTPINNAEVKLNCQSKDLLSTSTDPSGHFSLSVPYEIGIGCLLAAKAKCGYHEIQIPSNISKSFPSQTFFLKKVDDAVQRP